MSSSFMAAMAAISLRCCALKGLPVVTLLAFFLITLSLLAARTAGRDDPNDFSLFGVRLVFLKSLVFKADGMGDEQQQHVANHSERLPASLTTFNSIVLHQSVAIVEDMSGHVETHSVFPVVRSCFCRIPFKADHTYPIVTLLM